jgi:hypothetical protein
MAVEESVLLLLAAKGGPETAAELDSVAVAGDRVTASTDAMGVSMERTAKRSYLMNQALFTMRRLMYMGTLAIVGSSLLMLDWGVKFNLAMQNGRVILTRFLGSTQAANNELQHLFNLAAYTPFQFKDLVTAGATMLAFGYSVKQVNRTLADLTDALVGTNRATPAALNRVSVALGHMMSIGHATGQVLLQLARDGIPGVYKSIEKYFKLTPAQMKNVGALGLPSAEVLTAIEQGIENSKLHGLAKKMQESTLHGVFTTFKDFTSQLMGNFLQTPMNWIQKTFNVINPALQRMQAGFKTGGFSGMWQGLTKGMPTGWEKDLQLMGHLLSQIWNILKNGVLPVFQQWFDILKPVLGVLLLATTAIGFMNDNLWLTKAVLFVLIGMWITLKVEALAALAVTKAGIFAQFITDAWLLWRALYFIALELAIEVYWYARYFWAVGRAILMNKELIASQLIEEATVTLMVWWIKAATIATTVWGAVVAGMTWLMDALGVTTAYNAGLMLYLKVQTWALAAAETAWLFILGLLEPAMVVIEAEAATLAVTEAGLSIVTYATVGAMLALDAAMGVLDFLMLLDPITWVLIAIVALSAGLYELITHWKQVKQWVLDNAVPIAAAITLMFGPIGVALAAILLLIKYWGEVKSIFGFLMPSGNQPTIASAAHKYAVAGIPLVSPWHAISAPYNSSPLITPKDNPSPIQSPWHDPRASGSQPIHVTLNVDGKKLAEVVAKHKDDVRARQ